MAMEAVSSVPDVSTDLIRSCLALLHLLSEKFLHPQQTCWSMFVQKCGNVHNDVLGFTSYFLEHVFSPKLN